MTTEANEDYIKKILASNAAWAADLPQTHPEILYGSEAQIPPQEPKILWIGCADSRVSEAMVLDINPGDVFVHRNIANQLHLDDNNALSALQFAVDTLLVPDVFIVGHTRCGGVAAALREARSRAAGSLPSATPGKAALSEWLEPFTQLIVDRFLPELEGLSDGQAERRLVDENVKAQVEHLACTQTIRNAWTERGSHVRIHGFVYQLETGLLENLRISRDWKGPID